MMPEKLLHLFDRYYRVDALGHQFSGLGPGLYISSEIINRHGGKIGADSTLGDGVPFGLPYRLNSGESPNTLPKQLYSHL